MSRTVLFEAVGETYETLCGSAHSTSLSESLRRLVSESVVAPVREVQASGQDSDRSQGQSIDAIGIIRRSCLSRATRQCPTQTRIFTLFGLQPVGRPWHCPDSPASYLEVGATVLPRGCARSRV